MRYGQTYTLTYISEENGKLLFDVIDENGTNLVLDGTMQDLRSVLYFSDDLTIEMSFNELQDAIFEKPITFIAGRKALRNMNELDFNL